MGSGYHMNLEQLERQIEEENIKMMFLCSPHNPIARVWRREELERLGDICYKHQVLVVSDKIHSDLVFQGKHSVFATVKPEFEEFSIICTAPSKTFNIAGLQVSNIIIPNRRLRKKFRRQLISIGTGILSMTGIAACKAAYQNGEVWYQAMMNYIKENIEYVESYIKEELPEIKVANQEGTYLMWLDFRGLNLEEEQLETLLTEKAKIWLNRGSMFGIEGKDFQRMNVACPRSLLKTGSYLQVQSISEINRIIMFKSELL